MEKQVIVREAVMEDLPVLLDFEQKLIQWERPFDPTIDNDPVHYYDIPGMIQDSDTRLVVAEIDNRVVGSGYARIEKAKIFNSFDHHAYLGFMYVDPAYRGMGINNMIIASLKGWAHSRGIDEVRLEVYFDNASAIRAYEKAGLRSLMIVMRGTTSEGNT